MRKDEKNSKRVIYEHIHGIMSADKKLVYVDVYDGDTGELIEEMIPIFKYDYKKSYNSVPKYPVTPWVKISGDVSKLEDLYYSHFTTTEQGYLFKLFRRIDAFGRIKYGSNYQQYCRNTEDFSKVLGVSYNTIKQTLVPKMRKYDLIRIITIKKGHELADEHYISFNPLLVTNGVFWDRWALIAWKDVVEKYNLLNKDQIKKILDCEETHKTEQREIIPRELEIWE